MLFTEWQHWSILNVQLHQHLTTVNWSSCTASMHVLTADCVTWSYVMSFVSHEHRVRLSTHVSHFYTSRNKLKRILYQLCLMVINNCCVSVLQRQRTLVKDINREIPTHVLSAASYTAQHSCIQLRQQWIDSRTIDWMASRPARKMWTSPTRQQHPNQHAKQMLQDVINIYIKTKQLSVHHLVSVLTICPLTSRSILCSMQF